ncbi:MAG: hypothetical protein FWE95_00840 [Planctomycetaceae bacterium]|nr:hypothetical protein [Planctomycetaceae bacterium]
MTTKNKTLHWLTAILILLLGNVALAEAPFTAEEQAAIERFVTKHGTDVKAADENGKTLLHKAVTDNAGVAVFKFLVSEGADVHAKDSDGYALPASFENASPQVAMEGGGV